MNGNSTPLPALHYFDEDAADPNDMLLNMAIGQGYVPAACLLYGALVMAEMHDNRDPCAGCAGPREKCQGRAKRN